MIDILDALQHIDPAMLDYQEWVNVGMGLKKEGYTAADWENWSAADPRHKDGECYRKWESFGRTDGDTVGGGTIVEYAKRSGWHPHGDDSDRGHAIGWDDWISAEDGVIVDPAYLETGEFTEPDNTWDPAQDLITYLETLFRPSEIVAYSTQTYEEDGRKSPTRGAYVRTAGELIEKLHAAKANPTAAGAVSDVFGTLDPEAGAWIRFNPFDGKGVKNSNVTQFRYALVESDSMDLVKQEAALRKMELPIAAMVYSGKKSVHAIVRVDAADMQEYRQRVEYLYGICEKNGLKVDTQNKNPSRLSRMPGVMRNGHKQFLMAKNIGKASWNEWRDWVEAETDGLPGIQNVAEALKNLPDLNGELIKGVLRLGHKMLLAGPSKAGKSYALIELAIAIATGTEWMGRFECAQGKVLYINLELDETSCLHRFEDVCKALRLPPQVATANIETWPLRGYSVPMDKLAPKIIYRAQKKGYIAVIIDPIYKVITGDENSADQMAAFCNQFDKICTQLKCAVIYCHHFAKGAQGTKKSVDRASGSGVFARDPDTLMTITQLEVSKDARSALDEEAEIIATEEAMDLFLPGWRNVLGDEANLAELRSYSNAQLDELQKGKLYDIQSERLHEFSRLTAWRIEGTLREFPPFEPVNVWFRHPVHIPDIRGDLSRAEIESPVAAAVPKESGEERTERRRKSREDELAKAFEACADDDGTAGVAQIAKELKRSLQTVRNWVDESEDFVRDGGRIRSSKNSI